MEILQGLMLNLKCRVQGDKDPQIKWYKDGIPLDDSRNNNIEITFSVRRSHLKVKNVKPTDSGNYSCIGASGTSKISRWVYVTVIPSPDERSVADEKARIPCTVNICSVGKCYLIDEKPTCRCPPSYTGPDCTIPVKPYSNLSTPNPIRSTIEQDYILDQTLTDAPQKILTEFDPGWGTEPANKCSLPDYRDSPECIHVDSYLYTFIGTAVACSVIILLAVSLLGYLRRRRILKQQYTTTNRKNDQPKPAESINVTRKYSPILSTTRHSRPDCNGKTVKLSTHTATKTIISNVPSKLQFAPSLQRNYSDPAQSIPYMVIKTPGPHASVNTRIESVLEGPKLDASNVILQDGRPCLQLVTISDAISPRASQVELRDPTGSLYDKQPRQLYVPFSMMPTPMLLKSPPNGEQVSPEMKTSWYSSDSQCIDACESPYHGMASQSQIVDLSSPRPCSTFKRSPISNSSNRIVTFKSPD